MVSKTEATGRNARPVASVATRTISEFTTLRQEMSASAKVPRPRLTPKANQASASPGRTEVEELRLTVGVVEAVVVGDDVEVAVAGDREASTFSCTKPLVAARSGNRSRASVFGSTSGFSAAEVTPPPLAGIATR